MGKEMPKVSGDEYKKYLYAKLQEELDEFLESDEVEELTDLQEVIWAIIELKGLTRKESEKIRLDKKAERGGFRFGYVLD
jgi:predicted house-cleaning noncanonical NTP pyrophosphatase (MazG superfamily)